MEGNFGNRAVAMGVQRQQPTAVVQPSLQDIALQRDALAVKRPVQIAHRTSHRMDQHIQRQLMVGKMAMDINLEPLTRSKSESESSVSTMDDAKLFQIRPSAKQVSDTLSDAFTSLRMVAAALAEVSMKDASVAD